MALKAAKKNLVNEYYVYYVCDTTTDGGKTTKPHFEKALKRDLVKLGGVQKFAKIPTTAYKTASGLTHKFRRSEDGVIYCEVTGSVRGKDYNNSVVVNPPLSENLAIVTTSKEITKSVAGKVVKSQEKIGLHFTPAINRQQIAEFTQSVLVPAGKALAIKVGKDTEILALGAAKLAVAAAKNVKERSAAKKKGGIGKAASKKAGNAYTARLAVPTYIPLGEITANSKLTKAGSVNQNGSAKTIVYAVLYEESAVLMGLAKLELSTATTARSGTKIATAITSSSGKFKGFAVFSKLVRYAQCWTDVSSKNNESQTSIANSGTGTKVKLRYTSNSVGSGNAISSNNQYAYFNVPSAIPVAFIMEAILRLPSRPRGFQVSNGGTNYGTSYVVPQRNGKLKE